MQPALKQSHKLFSPPVGLLQSIDWPRVTRAASLSYLLALELEIKSKLAARIPVSLSRSRSPGVPPQRLALQLGVQVQPAARLAERRPPSSHDTGWWFPLPWRHFLLPALRLAGNLSQGYSPSLPSLPPSFLHSALPADWAKIRPSDKVTASASAVHPLPSRWAAEERSLHFPSLYCLFRNSSESISFVATFLLSAQSQWSHSVVHVLHLLNSVFNFFFLNSFTFKFFFLFSNTRMIHTQKPPLSLRFFFSWIKRLFISIVSGLVSVLLQFKMSNSSTVKDTSWLLYLL